MLKADPNKKNDESSSGGSTFSKKMEKLLKATDATLKVAMEIYHFIDNEEDQKEDIRMSRDFTYKNTMDILTDKKLSTNKVLKHLKHIFLDEKFMEWLFNPQKGNSELTNQVMTLYGEFVQPRTIKLLIKLVQEEGDDYGRNQATFLMSLCSAAIANNNQRIKNAQDDKKNGNLSGRDYRDEMDDAEDNKEKIEKLYKMTKTIVKNDAKRLSRDTNLSKEICRIGYFNVPEPKYVDRYKIGFYLNTLLAAIYAEVSEEGRFDTDVDWKEYFKNIFGKDNVFEVATFVLLEGVNRIDKYNNNGAVRDCWESLTSFALKQLDNAPDQIRSQMVELYIKRIDKMFANRSYDLRVNMMDLSDYKFPNLAKTVDRYKDKIMNILKRGSTIDQAK